MQVDLILGECVEKMKDIPRESIDLTITSPPYDNMRDYKGYSFDYESTAKEIFRLTKSGGVVVWVVGDQTDNFCESLSSFKQAIYFVEQCGFNLLDTMIYQKNGGPSSYPGLRRYRLIFEYMFVFSKGRPKTFNPIKDRPNKSYGKLNSGNTARQKDGSLISNGSYIQDKFSMRTNIWTYDVGKNKDTRDKIAMKHPARFPEKLAEDHIISWSNEGDVVFDPFMGSGTTGKMAILNNRHFVGIEMSKEYFNIAETRIESFRGIAEMFE